MSKAKFRKLVASRGGVKSVAHEMGVSIFAVYRWMNGERTPKSKSIAQIVKLSKGDMSFNDVLKMRGN